jgi:hypothetical protein
MADSTATHAAIVASLNATRDKSPTERAAAVQNAVLPTDQITASLAANPEKSAEDQATAIEAAAFPKPSQDVANFLWKVVVLALAGIAGLALVGLVILLAIGKAPDVVLTAFTATVTGLLGLFVQSPVASH